MRDLGLTGVVRVTGPTSGVRTLAAPRSPASGQFSGNLSTFRLPPMISEAWKYWEISGKVSIVSRTWQLYTSPSSPFPVCAGKIPEGRQHSHPKHT